MSSDLPPEYRAVVDESGNTWQVYVVSEGRGWDADLPDRRSDWLKCVSQAARRFIAPVPDGWLTWTDAQLLQAIARARPDKRRT